MSVNLLCGWVEGWTWHCCAVSAETNPGLHEYAWFEGGYLSVLTLDLKKSFGHLLSVKAGLVLSFVKGSGRLPKLLILNRFLFSEIKLRGGQAFKLYKMEIKPFFWRSACSSNHLPICVYNSFPK